MDLITTQLGRFNATGKGFITRGLPGAHNATVTVTGAGAVSATVVIRGGNSQAAMVTIATINASGTNSAAGSRAWSDDYQFWEAEVTAISGAGAVVSVDCVSDVGSGSGGEPPFAGEALARSSILDAASAGVSTTWLAIAAYPERLAYQLDSGSVNTTFSIDVSADGLTSLGQAFTGSWARSDVAELTPPLMFANPQARFFRFNVLSGGPLSVSRGY